MTKKQIDKENIVFGVTYWYKMTEADRCGRKDCSCYDYCKITFDDQGDIEVFEGEKMSYENLFEEVTECGKEWSGLSPNSVMIDNGVETKVTCQLPSSHDRWCEWSGSTGSVQWVN